MRVGVLGNDAIAYDVEMRLNGMTDTNEMMITRGVYADAFGLLDA